MNSLATLGKYLDQPLLVSRFSKKVPPILIGGAAAYGLYDTYKAPEHRRKNIFVKNTLVLSATVSSALLALKGAKFGKIKIPGLIDIPKTEQVVKRSKRLISRFDRMLDKSPNIDEATKELFKNKRIGELLNKMTENPLKRGEVKDLYGLVGENKWGKKFLNKLIPPPKNLSAKEIGGEIGRLSLLGAIPVIGGITGGIAACVANGHKLKERAKPKVKEGLYQYLANIVLCNVGAAGALGIMETPVVKNFIKSKNINSKMAKAGAMTVGVLAIGVMGGSAIANFIGKKIVDPLFKDKQKQNSPVSAGLENLYNERHPEALDVALHSDDLATIGVLSGFSWIEPALPIMYSISGYRAGMGYRNGHTKGYRRMQGQGQMYSRYRKFNQDTAVGASPLLNSVKANNDAFWNFLTIKQRGKNFLQ